MVLGLNGQILVALNLDMIFFLVNVWSRALSTHPTNDILSSSMQFLLTIGVSLSFLKVLLKGLKQAMSKS
jgi:hypothetical protein